MIGDALAMRWQANASLSLCRKDVGARGAASIFEALKINNTLTRIDLRHNDIGVEGTHGESAGCDLILCPDQLVQVNRALTSLGLAVSNMRTARSAYANTQQTRNS